MTCTGVVRGRRVELDGDAPFPEGTRVRVFPESSAEEGGDGRPEAGLSLGEWLRQARDVRAQLPETSDSVEVLRSLRESRFAR
jgi:hypothetical protein